MSKYSTYFSSRYILSKNSLYNVILSDRSDGKTTNIKIQVILDYFTKEQISMVVRRYKTEMTQTFYIGFLDKVFNNIDDIKEITEEEREIIRKAKKYEYKYGSDGICVRKNKKTKWERMCFFVVLSTSGKKKSAYDTFCDKIFKIHFDEYVPLDGRYLPDDMTYLNELYTSVDRDRNVVQLILYGNKIDLFNPFFNFFDLRLDINSAKMRTYRNGTLSVQIYINEEHKEERTQSKLSELFSGTNYEEYRVGNVLNELQIKKGNIEKAEYMCSFKSEIGEGSIWYDGNYIISRRIRKDGYLITDKIYNTDREQYQVNYGRFAKTFRLMYRKGQMVFESVEAFHAFEPILRKAGN